MKKVIATAGNVDCGRLGHVVGSHASFEFFTVVKSLVGVQPRAVAAGGAHTAVLADDGTVFTFGLNSRGQLGHSDKGMEETHYPSEIPLPEPAVAVAAGHLHTLCITESGLLWGWGCNKSGQLGLGNDVDMVSEPRLVAALKNTPLIGIAAGAQHSIAVSKSGEVYTWGDGGGGKLGHGSPPALSLWGRYRSEAKPRLVRALETQVIREVAAGHAHTACVSDNGTAYVFGSGKYHQLGRVSTDEDAHSPIQLPGPPSVTSIACGGAHSLAILPSGHVISWGQDQHGCLGLGRQKGMRGPMLPQPISKSLVAQQVSAGWKHSAAVTHGGVLHTWGWGGSQGSAFSYESSGSAAGQLGHGNEFDYWDPVAVTHLATQPGNGGGVAQFSGDGSESPQLWRVAQVSCGLNHTAAVFEVSSQVALPL